MDKSLVQHFDKVLKEAESLETKKELLQMLLLSFNTMDTLALLRVKEIEGTLFVDYDVEDYDMEEYDENIPLEILVENIESTLSLMRVEQRSSY